MIKTITTNEFKVREQAAKLIDLARESRSPKKVYLDLLEARKQVAAEEVINEGFNDIYGFWFCGAARQAAGGFGQAVTNQKKIEPGVHPADMYGIPCYLYTWTANGYPRGIILAVADDISLHEEAQMIMTAGPWDPTPVMNIGRGDDTLVSEISKAIKAAEFTISQTPASTPNPTKEDKKPAENSSVKNMLVNFGKYKGMTVEEVKKRDSSYFSWLTENASSPDIVEFAQKAANA